MIIEPPLVLAVDDHEDNLFLLSYSLEMFNCKFVGETSSRAALEFVKLHQPALILLDLLMPEIQGIELMQLLRQQQNTGNSAGGFRPPSSLAKNFMVYQS